MADMAAAPVDPDDPFNEAVATTGLFLIIGAIIAVAVALASWGLSETLLAVLAGTVALVSFTASILCFRNQAGDAVVAEVSA
ncbi:hypothetical protein [Mycolicibacterium sp.]|uniref:hypothetical protein n=1 Tax=Mycolicibacterium sp. TaxID=2320850 RepID=UPI003D148011